jgi:hypothetical protein
MNPEMVKGLGTTRKRELQSAQKAVEVAKGQLAELQSTLAQHREGQAALAPATTVTAGAKIATLAQGLQLQSATSVVITHLEQVAIPAAQADLVGLSKGAILKAIKSGKVSATKDINGIWRLEPVEVLRVWKPASDSTQPPAQTIPQPSIDGLQRENELLRETVADLRTRLDAESEERRRLSLILNESRSAAPPSPAPQTDKPKGFWARLFGY